MTLLTEEEAKTKWCPFGRFIPPGEHEGPFKESWWAMSETPSANQRCIASGCMAWRTSLIAPKVADKERYITGGYCGAFGNG
mgnify:CR=1 FL=1